MPIDPKVAGRELPPLEFQYKSRDTILYALGIGAGIEPDELKFVYENGQQVIPTFGVIPPYPALAAIRSIEGFDFNPAMLLHGEHYLEMYRQMEVEDRVTSYPKVAAVYDKGKGALIVTEVVTRNEKGEDLFFNRYSSFVRGEGGFGGEKGPKPGNEPPGRAPDRVVSMQTLPQQAMIYRLSGDYNPLHIDPGFAAAGGFPKPILHGLCTLGFAGRAVLREYCGNDPAKFKAINVRFSHHVYPGETIITEMWKEGEQVFLRSKTAERGEYCLTNAAVWLNP